MRLVVLTILLGAAVTAVSAHEPCGCDQKVCKSVTEEKKTDKRVFGHACEDFCLPKCCWSSLWHHGCNECGCCEDKVRCRKFLVVKICKEETCVKKCVVEKVANECIAPPMPAMPIQLTPVPTPPPAAPMPGK